MGPWSMIARSPDGGFRFRAFGLLGAFRNPRGSERELGNATWLP